MIESKVKDFLIVCLLLLITLFMISRNVDKSDSIETNRLDRKLLQAPMSIDFDRNLFNQLAEADANIQTLSSSSSSSSSFRKNKVSASPATASSSSSAPLETMTQIGQKTGTDKVLHHGYDRFYPMFLEHFRTKVGFKMFEIGYLHGQSYAMWVKYFANGMVYFMDKDNNGDKTPGLSRFQGSQANEADLSTFLDTRELRGNLDFIIDDGSHHPAHQIFSFIYLFQHGLKPGGVYIIEDIEMNYWTWGETYGEKVEYGRDSPKSIINMLKLLVDAAVNREYAQVPGVRFKSPFGSVIDDDVSGVFFGQNCVVITKMTPEEKSRFGSRVYRYSERVSKKESSELQLLEK